MVLEPEKVPAAPGPSPPSRSRRPDRRDRRDHGAQCKAVRADKAGSGPRGRGGRAAAGRGPTRSWAGPPGRPENARRRASTCRLQGSEHKNGWGRGAAAKPSAGLKNDQQQGSTTASELCMVKSIPTSVPERCKDTRTLHVAS